MICPVLSSGSITTLVRDVVEKTKDHVDAAIGYERERGIRCFLDKLKQNTRQIADEIALAE